VLGRRARLASTAAFLGGAAAALWVLWGPIITHTIQGGSLRLSVKNFYVQDQFSVMSIARLAQDGLSVYREPYSATGDSVYPSEYYRLLGETAHLTGTTVMWAWNVVGVLVSVALIALAVFWSVSLAPGTRAWVLAPLPFLVGTLYWWVSGSWIYLDGGGVLWPGVASLYSPGGETAAVLVAGLALILLLRARGARGRQSIWLAVAAGLATGISLQVHANAAVFCGVAVLLVLLWDYLLGDATARRRAVVGSVVIALVVVAAIAPASGVVGRVGVLGLAIAVGLATDRSWRRRRGLVAVAWAAAAALASLPLSARLAAQTLSGEGYFYTRQESTTAADTSLPLFAVFWMMLPVWALAALVIVRLVRDGPRATPGWAAFVGGLTCATLLLTTGGYLGAEGLEWHRFLIIGSVLTTMAAGPGLWLILRDARPREVVAGWGVVALLAATLPATIDFSVSQRDAVFSVVPQDVEAYDAIHRAAGDRLLLLDQCMLPGPIRVLSGARVVAISPGIAVPPHRDATDAALDAIKAGHLPSRRVLRELGVGGFVTHTVCAGVPPEEMRARFGEPYRRIPLRDAEKLGVPADTSYELYLVPDGRAG
jgi:hypothetical protein